MSDKERKPRWFSVECRLDLLGEDIANCPDRAGGWWLWWERLDCSNENYAAWSNLGSMRNSKMDWIKQPLR